MVGRRGGGCVGREAQTSRLDIDSLEGVLRECPGRPRPLLGPATAARRGAGRGGAGERRGDVRDKPEDYRPPCGRAGTIRNNGRTRMLQVHSSSYVPAAALRQCNRQRRALSPCEHWRHSARSGGAAVVGDFTGGHPGLRGRPNACWQCERCPRRRRRSPSR